MEKKKVSRVAWAVVIITLLIAVIALIMALVANQKAEPASKQIENGLSAYELAVNTATMAQFRSGFYRWKENPPMKLR